MIAQDVDGACMCFDFDIELYIFFYFIFGGVKKGGIALFIRTVAEVHNLSCELFIFFGSAQLMNGQILFWSQLLGTVSFVCGLHVVSAVSVHVVCVCLGVGVGWVVVVGGGGVERREGRKRVIYLLFM